MAVLEAEFESKTLLRSVSFRAILPLERFQPPYPAIYLLHGLGGSSSRWLHYTNIRGLAEKSGIAVILPSGENSFYLDIPVKNGCLGDFGAYVGEELVQVTREMFPLSHRREDTFISGMSMGGYGALRNGLKYHDTFGGIAVFLWASIRILAASGSQGRWMSREEFLEDWIVDRKTQKGYKYQDEPGCYVIASYERPLKSSDQIRNYQNVYVGQSLRVYHRIFSHFSGRGNGEVYSDIRDGLYVYVRVVLCREKKLNEMERRLIQVYHATKSYNKTEGGGTIRR